MLEYEFDLADMYPELLSKGQRYLSESIAPNGVYGKNNIYNRSDDLMGTDLFFDVSSSLSVLFSGVPRIEKVIFNEPATIIFWGDDTKTVVKCEHEIWDPEKGLAMAIAKKALGNKGNYYKTFKKYLGRKE